MFSKRRLASLAFAVIAFGGLAVSATPASAATGDGFVSGTGEWRDDWSDEGPISASSHSHTNAAAMWQAILWADGYFGPISSVDCDFGSNTTAATKSWQKAWMGSGAADGIVGKHTMEAASGGLQEVSNSGGYLTLRFDGYHDGPTGKYVTFTRNTDGDWGMYIGSSDHHLLSYTYANFNQCA